MKRLKHTLSTINQLRNLIHKNPLMEKAKAVEALFLEKKIRLSRTFGKKICSFSYAANMNDFLRELSENIKDREAMMALYDLVDAVIKSDNEETFRKKGLKNKRQAALETKFRNTMPKRYKKTNTALHEEARLRKLNLAPSMCRDHCFIWKNYFNYSTNRRLKTLMSLNNDEFNKLMYGFAAELASEAKNWNTWDYFDWREFSYAGFHRAEFEAFLSLRKKHLRLLELPANADLTMIQKRFKQLAKEHHPDKGGNQELMCKLNIAYSYLKEHTRG